MPLRMHRCKWYKYINSHHFCNFYIQFYTVHKYRKVKLLTGTLLVIYCVVQLMVSGILHFMISIQHKACVWCLYIIFTLCVSTTGTHLQVDEEWFLQPFHPFQCLPGVITGQEEGKKHKAWLKTLDKCLSLKIWWEAEKYMWMTVYAYNLCCCLHTHRLFSLGDAETCPRCRHPQARLFKVC